MSCYIFLVPVEGSAKDIDEVIALAFKKKYRAGVDKTLPISQVEAAHAWMRERRSERSSLLLKRWDLAFPYRIDFRGPADLALTDCIYRFVTFLYETHAQNSENGMDKLTLP